MARMKKQAQKNVSKKTLKKSQSVVLEDASEKPSNASAKPSSAAVTQLAAAIQSTKTAAPVTSAQPVFSSTHLTFEQLLKLFGIWFVVQSAVVVIAHWLFPASVVLGTNLISPFLALLNSMVVLTLFSVGAVPLIELVQDLRQHKIGPTEWMLLYFGVNTIGFWIIARFAEQLGLGLSSWIVAALLGLVVSAVQGLFAMRVE